VKTKRVHTLVIGSGASGLCAALRLHSTGMTDLLVCSEGLDKGTSVNTGSDKQTYYKLGMYGAEPDSPGLMAQDLFAGGSVHGDLALIEAAVSPQAFAHLTSLGVPFPHDEYGQYIGYKTDHDPKRRATSCGPYTSRDMCRALISALKERGVKILEQRVVFSLLTIEENGAKRCAGALMINRKAPVKDCVEAVQAENVVFAVGGPGGLYGKSVYPEVHTGGIGIALEAGAKARSLPESQFGLASVKFRWNVSGSYMQVLPRFISTNADGGDEREFLREYFASLPELQNAVFLKGYQWPFSAGHVPGSSLIDLFTYVETEIRHRRVWLDYRRDPADFDFSSLPDETRSYLEKSGCTGDTPLKRLACMNAPAIDLYREHGIDLANVPLEIAVCAQHNNGGLAADLWWESENIQHLFPVGEVNGSHGVIRPGGSALNAGQVGAFRAAERIAAKYSGCSLDNACFDAVAEKAVESLSVRMACPPALDWRAERKIFQSRMSLAGAFLRRKDALEKAIREARAQLAKMKNDGLACPDARDLSECLRNRSLLTASVVYLEAILAQVNSGVGSRGGAVVLADTGCPVHPKLDFRIVAEDTSFRSKVQESILNQDGSVSIQWTPCRPLPRTDGWFETVWRQYRDKQIYDTFHEAKNVK